MLNANAIMLYFSLAMVAIIALFALWGFIAGLKRELKFTVVLIIILLIVWAFFGNGSNLLDMKLPGFLSNIFQSGFDLSDNATTLRKIVEEIVRGIEIGGQLLVEGSRAYALFTSILEGVVRLVGLLVGTLFAFILAGLIRFIAFIVRGIISLVKRGKAKRAAKKTEQVETVEAEATPEPTETVSETAPEDDGVVIVEAEDYTGDVVVTISKQPRKVKTGSKRRLWGAGVGLLKGMLFVILLSVPFTGIFSIVNAVDPNTVDVLESALNLNGKASENGHVWVADSESTLDFLFDLAEAYDKAGIQRFINSSKFFFGKSIDLYLFDTLAKFETSSQTIYLREELITYINVANVALKAYDPETGSFDIWSLSDADLDILFGYLNDAKLISEIIPVGIEYAGTIDTVKDLLAKSNQSLDKLIAVDWANDLPKILRAVRAALKLGDFTSEDFDPFDLDSDVLREIVSNIGSTAFIKELMPVVINAALKLDFVQDLIGDIGKVDTSEVNWQQTLLTIVDVYDDFKALELDFDNLSLDTFIQLLRDDAKRALLLSILEKLGITDLFMKIIVPVLNDSLNKQLDDLGLGEFKDILDLIGMTPEQWLADFDTILQLASLAEQLGLLTGEFKLSDTEKLQQAVELIFSLNLIQGKETELLIAALKQFEILDASDLDFSKVDWTAEKNNIIELIGILAEFNTLDGFDLDDFGSLDFNKLMEQEAFYDLVVRVLEVAAKSELIKTILPKALDEFVTPMLKDSNVGQALIDAGIFDDITSETAQEEIQRLINIINDVAKLIDFSKEGDLIDRIKFSEVDALEDIIDNLLSSRFLKGREGRVIRALLVVFDVLELSEGYLNDVDFTNEKDILINAIDKLRPVLTDPDFALMVQDENGEKVFNTDYFISDFVIGYGLDFFDALLESQLIAKLLPEIYHQMVVEMIPEDFRDLIAVQNERLGITEGLTAAELVEDLHSVVKIGREALALGLVGFYKSEFKELTLTNLEPLANIVKELFDLNLFNYNPAKIMVKVLGMAGIEMVEEDFASIDWTGEADLIAQAILALGDAINATGLSTLQAVLDYVKAGNYLDNVTEDVVGKVAEALGYLFKLDLIKVVFHPAYDQLLKDSLGDMAKYLSVAEYTGEELEADLLKIVEIIKVANTIPNYLEIARDFLDGTINNMVVYNQAIPYDHEIIPFVITTLTSLNIVNHNVQGILDFVTDNLGISLAHVPVDEMDLAGDGAQLAAVYQDLLKILTDADFFLKTFGDIEELEEIPFDFFYSKDDFAHVALDALTKLVNLTTVRLAIPDLFEYAKTMIPEEFAFLLDMDNTDEAGVVADLNALIEALRPFVDAKVLDFLRIEDVSLDLSNEVVNLIDVIVHMSLLSGKGNQIVELGLSYADIDYQFAEGTVNWLDEAEILKAIVGEVFTILKNNGFDTYKSVMNEIDAISNGDIDFMEYVTKANIDSVLAILDQVVTSKALEELIRVVYDKFGAPIVDELDPMIRDIVDISDLTNAQLMADLRTVVSILREVGSADIEGYLETEDTELWPLKQIIINVINLIREMNILDGKESAIFEYVLTFVDMDADTTGISLKDDLGVLTEVVQTVFVAFVNNELYKVSDVMNLIRDVMDGETDYLSYLTSTNVESLVSILEAVTRLSTVKVLALPAIEEFVVPMLEGTEFATLVDFDKKYTADKLIEDLRAVVNIIAEANAFGAIDIYEGYPIDFANTEPIENIFKALLGLNYLDIHKEKILTVVENVLDMDLTRVDLSVVDLASDGEKLGRFYVELSKVLADEDFIVKTIDDVFDIMNGAMEFDYMDIVRADYAYALIDALRELVSMSLVEAIIPQAMVIVEDMLDSQFLALTDISAIGAKGLVAEVQSLLDILEILVDLDALDYLDTEDFVFTGKTEAIVSILETVQNLNYLQDKSQALVELAFYMLDIDVDASEIRLQDELGLIITIVQEALNALERHEFSSLSDVMNFADREFVIDDYVTEENLSAIINILDALTDSKLIKLAFRPLYDKFVSPMLDGMDQFIQDLANLDGLSDDALFEDLDAIVEVIRQLQAFDAIGIYKGEDINFANTEPIEVIINKLLTLNYLDVKRTVLFDFAKDMLSDIDLSEVDITKVDFAHDAYLLAEAYKALVPVLMDKDNPFKSTGDIYDFMNGEFNFYFMKLVDEVNAYSVLDALKAILSTTLVEQGLPVALDMAKDFVPEDYAFLVDTDNITTQEVVADLLSVVEVLRLAVSAGAIEFYFHNRLDLLATQDEAIAALEIIRDLNILKGKDSKIVDLALSFVDMDADTSAISLKDDINAIIEIVEEIYNALANNGFATIQDIYDLINEIFDNEFDYNDYITPYNVNSLVVILEAVARMTLVKELALPAIDKFVAPMVEGTDFEDLVDLRGYTKEQLVEDLRAIVGIIGDANDFGATDIYHGGYINYANSEPVKGIFAKLFSLNYLTVKGQTIVDLLETIIGEQGIDLSLFDVDAVDFAGDGLLLGDFYEALLPILTDEDFPLTSIDAIKAFMEDLDYEQFLKDAYAHTALDALKVLVTTSLVKELIPVAFDFARQFVPAEFDFVFDLDVLTKDQVVEDLVTLLGTLHIVVDLDAIGYLTYSDFNIVGIEEQVGQIIRALTGLNILTIHYPELVTTALEYFVDVDTTGIDLSGIVWDDEFESIISAVQEMIRLVNANDLTTVKEVMDFVSELMNGEIDYMSLITSENVASIVSILEALTDMNLVYELAFSLFDAFVEPMVADMASYIQTLATLEGYTASTLRADVKAIVSILRNASEFGAVEIYEGYPINFANTDPIAAIFEALFSLNYLEMNKARILSALEDLLGRELSKVDLSVLDLAGDGEKLGRFYVKLAEILADEDFVVKSLDDVLDIMSGAMEFDYMDMVRADYAYALIDALRELVSTSLVEAVIPQAFDILNDILPSDILPLANIDGVGAKGIVEDLFSLLDVLEIAVDLDALDYFDTEDFVFTGKTEQILAVLEILSNLNYLQDRSQAIVEVAFSFLDITVDGSGISLKDELALIMTIVEQALNALERHEFGTLSDVMNFADREFVLDDYVTEENLSAIIAILEALTDSKLVKLAFRPVFDKFVSPMFDGMDQFVQDLANLDDYSDDALFEDLDAIVEVLRQLKVIDAVGIYKGEAIDYANTAVVETILEKVLTLNFIDVKRGVLFDFAKDMLPDIDFSNVDIDAVDFANDANQLAEAYARLVPVLMSDVNPLKTINDFFDFINGELYFYPFKFLTVEYVNYILDALYNLVSTTILKEAIPVAFSFAQNMVPAELGFLFDVDATTKEDAISDLYDLIFLARNVVDAGAIDLYYGIDIEINKPEIFKLIVDTIFDLKTLDLANNGTQLVEALLTLANIDISDVDYDQIDWDNEQAIIDDVIDVLSDILADNNFVMLGDLIDFIRDGEYKNLDKVD